MKTRTHTQLFVVSYPRPVIEPHHVVQALALGAGLAAGVVARRMLRQLANRSEATPPKMG